MPAFTASDLLDALSLLRRQIGENLERGPNVRVRGQGDEALPPNGFGDDRLSAQHQIQHLVCLRVLYKQ